MDELGRTIRRRAAELGLSQTALAEATGVHVRQIRRYQNDEQQPVLSVAAKLARALDLTLDELAGTPQDELDGTWWTAREVNLDGRPFVLTVDADFRASKDVLTIEGRGWHGELRRHATNTLTGFYADEHDRQGTMLFVLRNAVGVGRWVGTDARGAITGGHAALARTREAAQAAMTALSL